MSRAVSPAAARATLRFSLTKAWTAARVDARTSGLGIARPDADTPFSNEASITDGEIKAFGDGGPPVAAYPVEIAKLLRGHD